MKKIKYLFLPLLIILVSVTACKDDFLEVPPKTSLSSAELSSLAGLEGSLIASYAMMLGRDGFYSDVSNWLWGSIRGGDAHKGTDPGDQSVANAVQAYSVPTNNAPTYEKYRACYEGIARANATLTLLGVAQEGVPADALNRIEAEARFLRGFYYFELKKNFNNTPYVDEKWDEVTLVGNTVDLYGPIETDLKFAYDNLPETQADKGRANKWAAGALYAKVLMFQGKWADASDIFDLVISSGTTADGTPYGLIENYADAFRSVSDNSKESVFAVQAAANTGTINNANPGMVLNFPNGGGPGGCCGFFQPTFELANSFRTDANGLPLLDGSYNDSANELDNDMDIGGSSVWDAATNYAMDGLASVFDPSAPNKELVYKSLSDNNMNNNPLSSSANWELIWTENENDQSVDPRIDHSIGRRGIPYLDWGPHPGRAWVRNQPYGGPFAPKKFIYYQAGIGTENDVSDWAPGRTAINYNVIRFADVLLMAAECEIEKPGGDLDKAKDLINQVRQRAIDSPVLDANGDPAANYVIDLYSSFASQDAARQAVRFERKLELSGEGHRIYDLNRWGISATTLNAYLTYEAPKLNNMPFSSASFDANKDEFLPIPQNEIDLIGADVLKQNPGYN